MSESTIAARGSMKYRLLALDLDGTVFDSHGKVPAANIEAIHRMQDAGVLVALCTGRGLTESKPAIEALGFTGPLVLANGALVADAETGATLERAIIEPHVAMQVVDLLADSDDAVLALLDPAQAEHDYLVIKPERLTANTLWWFDYCSATYRGVDRPTEHDLRDAVRVGFVGSPQQMPGTRQRIVDVFGDRLFIQHFLAIDGTDEHPEPIHLFEVFAAGVNKWSALNWLAECYDIEPGEIAAIGDNINDVEMLAGAGCGVAMGNAVPEALAVSNRVTATHDEAGVAQAIERLMAEHW